MSEDIRLDVSGMTCMSCVGRVTAALESIEGASNVSVSLDQGSATFRGITEDIATQTILELGYSVGGDVLAMPLQKDFNWKDGPIWKQSANNTKWCLVGCSIGEFGTLAAYQYYGVHHHLSWDLINPNSSSFDLYIIFLFMLPLINGLATSVMLETAILVRGQMDLKNAISGTKMAPR